MKASNDTYVDNEVLLKKNPVKIEKVGILLSSDYRTVFCFKNHQKKFGQIENQGQ